MKFLESLQFKTWDTSDFKKNTVVLPVSWREDYYFPDVLEIQNSLLEERLMKYLVLSRKERSRIHRKIRENRAFISGYKSRNTCINSIENRELLEKDILFLKKVTNHSDISRSIKKILLERLCEKKLFMDGLSYEKLYPISYTQAFKYAETYLLKHIFTTSV